MRSFVLPIPTTPVPYLPGLDAESAAQTRRPGQSYGRADHRRAAAEPLDPRDVRGGKPPEDADGAVDWLNGVPRR